MPFPSRDFPVGCVRTSCPVGVGGWPSRNPVGISQSGPVGIRTQSGFSSRDFAQSGFLQSGPSRDSQSGQSAQSGPSRDFQLPSRDFPVGPQSGSQCDTVPCGLQSQSGRACSQSGSPSRGLAPVGLQSGFPSRAQSGIGPSRECPVGILPSRELLSRAPVGIPQSGFSGQSGLSRDLPSREFAQSGFAQSGIRSVGPQSGFPVGTVLPVGPQSGFVRPQSGPSRTA